MARSRPATDSERARAYRARKKLRAGGELSPKRSQYLRRYDRKVKTRRKRRSAITEKRRERKRATIERARAAHLPKRKISAREEALRYIRRLVVWFDVGDQAFIESGWHRPTRHGEPGIGQADADWWDPVLPAEGRMLVMPDYHTGRIMNVRVRVVWIDDAGRDMKTHWTSLTAMRKNRSNLAVDTMHEMDDLEKRTSIRAKTPDDSAGFGVDAVSVRVAEAGGRTGKMNDERS